jgi:hypothetical protein
MLRYNNSKRSHEALKLRLAWPGMSLRDRQNKRKMAEKWPRNAQEMPGGNAVLKGGRKRLFL